MTCRHALIASLGLATIDPGGAIAASASRNPAPWTAVTRQYCYDCHDNDVHKGDLNLEALETRDPAADADSWEKVVRKLNARHMPPIGKPRPDEPTYNLTVRQLTTVLDAASDRNPDPGRTASFRRLTRTEYQNAIRDLLALRIDVTTLLPRDEASHGFDNVTVGTLSPTLLDRYLTAAQKISRLALGTSQIKPGGDTYRIPADVTQEDHVEGLPFGTRGGTLIRHVFPADAEYEFHIRLARDRNEEIEGLNGRYDIDLLIDGQPIQRLSIAPPKIPNDYASVDANLKVRTPITGGEHEIGVTFVDRTSALLERKRQPYAAAFNMHRHPRLSPAIYQVSINGPYHTQGPGDTTSRRAILISRPHHRLEQDPCAEQILTRLMQRAYRRPVTRDDLRQPMRFFREARDADGFEPGIEAALTAILVSPEFLFRIESDPADLPPNTAYRVPDSALASRLSFFLWSSLPDDALLNAAQRGELSRPDTLAAQTRRMLADPRARSLVLNFADQWLHLRNLDSLTPDVRLFPDFDHNLRQAFRRETEMLFENVLENDLSVLELLKANTTFLNERLAKHYGIGGVKGSHFRPVPVTPAMHRGGLLRQGSVLAVTSYATRTSPVIRGHWILGNLLGTPPPPPPPNVPALDDKRIASTLSMRERLAEHRANPACASCHDVMDPVGFSLEHFDALGRWRDLDNGQPIDASGRLPDGRPLDGVGALEDGLLQRPELFVATLAEKLLTFALGRGLEPSDAPAIRHIVRAAQSDNYRLSAVMTAIVQSTPFRMRKTAP